MSDGLREVVRIRVTLAIEGEETIRWHTTAERHEAQALLRQLAQALEIHEAPHDHQAHHGEEKDRPALHQVRPR